MRTTAYGTDGPAPGAIFHTARGGHAGVVTSFIGAGGQGGVYAVEVRDVRFALKWYHPSYVSVDRTLKARLSRAIERGPPNDAFLWPIDLVEVPGEASFGYIMRLREPGYAGMRELIARPPARIEPPLAIRATICLEIAQSFLQLHSAGFCYQDVNFGNIFFKPSDGSVLICDNDNVDVDGVPASVYGTRKFMAPEIVRREAMPSTRSDLFSMAVLFFYVLHAWHPLDGKREAAIDIMDPAAEMDLYGERPTFIFDPADTSNGPLRGMHEPVTARWNALPQVVRALFIRSFTAGLSHPGARVQEAEWCAAFTAIVTSGFTCTACGFEHTVEVAGNDVVAPSQCLACGAGLVRPPVLVVRRSAICLTPGNQVPLHTIEPGARGPRARAGAVVERHPTKPDVIGLRNTGAQAWRVLLRDGGQASVAPGSTMRLVDGAVIEFGAVSGHITAPGPAAVAQRMPA